MRRQPVFPGAFLDEDGDAVGEGRGGFHDVEDFGDEFSSLFGVEIEKLRAPLTDLNPDFYIRETGLVNPLG